MTEASTTPRSPFLALAAVLVAFGAAKVAAQVWALGMLLGVVIACVGALTIGVVVLRAIVLH